MYEILECQASSGAPFGPNLWCHRYTVKVSHHPSNARCCIVFLVINSKLEINKGVNLKNLLSIMCIFFAVQGYSETVFRTCYGDQTSINIKLAINSDSQTLSLYATHEKSVITIPGCMGANYNSNGELFEYGKGELIALCSKEEGTKVHYVNDFDEWKLAITNSGNSAIDSVREWICE